jgi:hypothetical protein
MTATAGPLLTAEQYALLTIRGLPAELVRGRVVERHAPAPGHKLICDNIIHMLADAASRLGLGVVVVNATGIVARRDPDTVRAADVAFYRLAGVPPGGAGVVPDLAFRVYATGEKTARVLGWIGDCLEAGVRVVCLLDRQSGRLMTHRDFEGSQDLLSSDELHLPDVLGDLRVPVQRFFE